MFELIISGSYWALTFLWLAILWLYISQLRQSKNADKTVSILLFILAIDAFRTVFESAYFGLYFSSMFAIFPKGIYDVLSNPALLIIPKITNIIAGLLVLLLLIRHWIPRELSERAGWIEGLRQAQINAEILKDKAEEQSSKFESIFNGIPDAIVYVDTERRIISANAGMKRVFGYSIEDLAGKKTSILYESEAEFEHQGRIRFNMTAEKKSEPYETIYRRKDGQTFDGETVGTSIQAEDGSIIGFIGVMRDITERKKNEKKQKLAASVFTHAREGIAITDATGSIIDVNETFSQITGYAREEVLGKNPRILKSGRQGADFYSSMWKSLLENQYWHGEIWNRRKNGETFPEILTISAVCDERNQVQHYVALFTDITQIKEHQQQLEHMANYDVLTGLPNRTLLADRLQHAMIQSHRPKLSVAVAYIDLDEFKLINDTHGHEAGDEFLVVLTERMKEALREGDTLARLGGDEFVAVLVDLEKTVDCEPVLSRLLRAASETVFIGDKALKVSASIGVTLYPQDGANADQLMRHADQAMYVAKQMGKNQFHLFDVLQEEVIKSQRESIESIQRAIERSEFVLYYQPKVNMKTGKVIGAEALIRWQHPEAGLLSPADFLPIIEKHPLSIVIGDWVIDTALKQMSEWLNSGLAIPVSVNVGALQLQQKNFTTKLSAALSRYSDVQAFCLELEILETSALEDIHDVSTTMKNCLDIGVTFALDDFGTGFSSLTYLKFLPAKVLKIDQSFIRDMLKDSDDCAIVDGVIGLANAFDRQVIAEGVETIEHGTKLLEMGCELGQGYGIARPMPANEVIEWTSNWKPDARWII